MRHTRTAVRAVIAAAVLATGILFTSPAHAGPEAANGLKKERVGDCMVMSSSHQRSKVCIHKYTSNGKAYIFGWVDYADAFGHREYINAHLWLHRCQTNMNNCTMQKETYKGDWTDGYGRFEADTDTIAASFGWVYQTCADLDTDAVAATEQFEYHNVCSPWETGNPDSAYVQTVIPGV
jgi:hypothetical protein